MSSALRDLPDNFLNSPDGVSSIRINLKTGSKANEDESGFYEYFYQEYPPPEKGSTGSSAIASDETDTKALY
jgi:penicillin-binding protein 1A